MTDCHKVRHPARWRAERALKVVRRNTPPDRPRPTKVYRCPICRCWHLTSKGRHR